MPRGCKGTKRRILHLQMQPPITQNDINPTTTLEDIITATTKQPADARLINDNVVTTTTIHSGSLTGSTNQGISTRSITNGLIKSVMFSK